MLKLQSLCYIQVNYVFSGGDECNPDDIANADDQSLLAENTINGLHMTVLHIRHFNISFYISVIDDLKEEKQMMTNGTCEINVTDTQVTYIYIFRWK